LTLINFFDIIDPPCKPGNRSLVFMDQGEESPSAIQGLKTMETIAGNSRPQWCESCEQRRLCLKGQES